MIPTIGRIVIYRSRTGDYDVPAIITATKETLFQPNVERGLIPPLSDDNNVHLTVLSPGKPGHRGKAEDFKTVSPYPISENVGGTYQEWDIPEWRQPIAGRPQSESSVPSPGTWRWPTIIE